MPLSHGLAPACPVHARWRASWVGEVRPYMVQWSEDVIKADPFFGRSRDRVHMPPWVSNTIARDHFA